MMKEKNNSEKKKEEKGETLSIMYSYWCNYCHYLLIGR